MGEAKPALEPLLTNADGRDGSSLLPAFRRLGVPLSHGAPGDSERAAQRIWDELRTMRYRLRFDPEVAEEAVSVLALKLVQGVHQRARNPPATAEQVRGYLFRALRHTALNLLRARKLHREHLQPLEETGARSEVNSRELADPADPAGDAPERGLDLGTARRLREAAHKELRETIVPTLASGLRSDARSGFLESFEELRAVALGETTLDAVLSGHAGPSPSRDELRRARNAFDQRCSRVRRTLVEFLTTLPPDAAAERRTALSEAVSELRLRK